MRKATHYSLEIVEMWGFSQIPGSNDIDMLPGLYNLERFITADYNQISYIPVGACRISSFPVVYMKPFFLFGGLVSKQERHFTRRCRPYPRKCAKPRPFDKVSVAFTGGKLEGIKDRYGNYSLPKWSSYFRGILKRKRCLTCQDVFVKLEENKGRSEKKTNQFKHGGMDS